MVKSKTYRLSKSKEGWQGLELKKNHKKVENK